MVIGYDSLLLKTSKPFEANTFEKNLLNSLHHPNKSSHVGSNHRIEVKYDGPDLEELSTLLDIPAECIIDLHSSAMYTVRFIGFSPGFAYLDGLPKELHAPRRSNPRTRIAAGAVAIGGSHAGIYTIPSPGGWNWLGNTKHPLFQKELNSKESFTFQPSDTVQFIPI